MTKLKSKHIDVISVYRSKEAKSDYVTKALNELIDNINYNVLRKHNRTNWNEKKERRKANCRNKQRMIFQAQQHIC